MKILRVFSLLIGLLALAFTGYVMQQLMPLPGFVRKLIYLMLYWPYNFVLTLTHPTYWPRLSWLNYSFIATHVAAVIVSFLLARSLGRPYLEWSVLGFIFPYASIILALLRKSHADARSQGGPIKVILSLNVALLGILLLGGFSVVLGVLTGFLGGYASVWATNRFVSSDVGTILGIIEGLLVGSAASLVASALSMLCVIFFAMLSDAAFSGSGGGTPIYDAGGKLLGWVGGSSPSYPGGGGCSLMFAAPTLVIGAVVGAVAGAELNQGQPMDPEVVGLTASLVSGAILGIAGGSVGGIGGGIAAWRSDHNWLWILTGLVDGSIMGYVLYHRWLEVMALAAVGAVLGAALFHLTRIGRG